MNEQKEMAKLRRHVEILYVICIVLALALYFVQDIHSGRMDELERTIDRIENSTDKAIDRLHDKIDTKFEELSDQQDKNRERLNEMQEEHGRYREETGEKIDSMQLDIDILEDTKKDRRR